jgi:SNF2 family DNA or RNA helicase
MNWKNLTSKQLNELFEGVSFKTLPYKHQLATLAQTLGEGLRKVFYIHDIGLGKTLTALTMIQLWNFEGRVLVICPNSVIKTWIDEIKKHTEFSYCVLKGTRAERIKMIHESKAKIFIVNYEGLKLIGAEQEKGKYIPTDAYFRSIPFECFIADECHRFKNPSSLQTRIAQLANKNSRYSILMTGTPIGSSAQDLFGQFLVLDNGLTFGKSYRYFLDHFYYKENRFSYDWKPKRVCGICNETYTSKKDHLKIHNLTIQQYQKQVPHEETSESIILNVAKKYSVHYTRNECLDLPEKIYEERIVYPTSEQTQMTNEIIGGLPVLSIGRDIEYHTTKLIQITGGFILHGNETPYRFPKNPKLIELLNILPETNGKVIIYHYYIEESKIIQFELEKNGYKVAVVNGKVKNKEQELDKFMNDPSCSILLAHPKSGGEGLNLQISNTIIYYSTGYIGFILWEQSEGRIHRSGQTKSCLYIDIVMNHTIDRVLINAMKSKTDYVDSVMEYLKK